MDSETRKINIIRARRENPCATLREIGTSYGVTREYVRQVLSEAKKPTAAYHQTYLCIHCGKDMGTEKRLFCNRQCLSDYSRIKIACTYCGKLREYYAKWLIWQIAHSRRSTDLFFCSNVCQGKWAGENYGFIKKWDYSKVYQLRDETGWGALRIGQALGIPEGTTAEILRKRD